MAESDVIEWGETEWLEVERAVETWVKKVLGRYKVDFLWRDRAMGKSVKTPYAEVAFGDETPVGVDEVSTVIVGGKPQLEITGSRQVMLSVKVRAHDQSTFRQARRYADILRQSLSHPAYENALRDAGLGLEECLPVRSIPQSDGTRIESFALLEVRFNVVQKFVDTEADDEMGWVDEVDAAVIVDGNRGADVAVDVADPAAEPVADPES